MTQRPFVWPLINDEPAFPRPKPKPKPPAQR
jgi:hypothetical protein